MATPSDPRKVITPASFAVAPELEGLPLASPSRRAAAMLVDLLAVALLVNAGGVFFGIAGAIVLFRASARPASGTALRDWTRRLLRVSAAFVLFLTVVSAWGFWERAPDQPVEVQTDEGATIALSGLGLGPRELVLLATEIAAIGKATTDAEAQAAADRFAARLRESGVSEEKLEEFRDELRDADPEAEPRVIAALQRALGADELPPVPPAADSLARVYVAALEAGDSATVADARRQLRSLLSADETASLRRTNARLRQANDALEDELEELRDRSAFQQFFGAIADELGLGIGWLGLYFTALTALWRGQTLGKRMLGIRVIRLDGKPIGWWLALERFGGYTAGLFTGMLGFAQIFWDRNRQGIHDKITETVVIRSPSAAGQQPGGGTQPAAHGALHGRRHEVVSRQG